MDISVVIPALNEEGSIGRLIAAGRLPGRAAA
jgi:glycosyltransferase involved in cell wall biosynthesis